MTIETFKRLAQQNKYYFFHRNGWWLGATSSKMIGLLLKKGKIKQNVIRNDSYREISFMEYITLNAGYYSK